MAGNEGEYEVEAIWRAKVEKKRGKKVWLYLVKWKNYGPKDNTWEPVDSFAGGSEHFIEHFWNRVNTNGRDYHNLREFEVDEEFFPAGPPRRKKAKKVAEPDDVIEIPSSPSAAAKADSENEVRSIIVDDDEDEVQITTTTRAKRRRSSGAAEAEPSPSKRPKRGQPPGRRASEVEAEEVAKTVARKRSVPEIPRTNRGRAPVAEPSSSSARRPSIPRTRKRPSQVAPRASSSSPDELLLHPETNGKSRSSPAKSPAKRKRQEPPVEPSPDVEVLHEESASQDAADASAMIVDDSESEPPTFGVPSLLAPEPASEPAPEAGSSTSLPAHRSRAANPRVKLLDDHNLTETSGALSVKAKFMKRTTGANAAEGSPARSSPRVSKGKAGPGKSSSGLVVGGSRLVAQKGKLTTVKSKTGTATSRAAQEISSGDDAANGSNGLFFDITDVDDVPGLGQRDPAPKSPPSGKELLKEAGMDDSTAKELPDFEEDAEGEDDIEFVEKVSQSQSAPLPNGEALTTDAEGGATETAPPEDIQKVPEKPPVVLEARPLTFASRVTSAWSQSTIFGPLALGLSPTRNHTQDESTDSSSAPKRYTLNLNLDSAVSLPITLKDTHASSAFLEKIDPNARNPTGKFYKDEHAIALVNTLGPQGSYARVTLSDDATEEQKKHFERFVSRMVAGELFIQMNRFEPLVMCASENSVLGQKLAVPAALMGLARTVVVTHVSIEDHCAYADAAERADGARW